MLNLDPSSVETAMEQAQLSLKPVTTLVRTIQDIKAAQPHVKFYIMSNICPVSLIHHVRRNRLIDP